MIQVDSQMLRRGPSPNRKVLLRSVLVSLRKESEVQRQNKPEVRSSHAEHQTNSRVADLRIQKTLEFMRENLERKLPLSELANAVDLSVWRLCHVFRSETGMSPIQYLRYLRLEKARCLLETSLLSIAQITRQIGLNDQSHFVRDFKKSYGKSPTLYRVRFQEASLEDPITCLQSGELQ